MAGLTVDVIEYEEGDVILMYSDGFSDNVYRSGYYQCLEEELENGIIKSLSKAADCLARKAYFLAKQLEYIPPFHKSGMKMFREGRLSLRD